MAERRRRERSEAAALARVCGSGRHRKAWGARVFGEKARHTEAAGPKSAKGGLGVRAHGQDYARARARARVGFRLGATGGGG
jgi:hypothetical protein